MSQEPNFSSLSLRDALDIAVLIEEEAQERYGELADQLELHNTPEAAQFFRHMVTNEGKHADRLRQRRKEIFGDEPVTVDLSLVPEVEAPAYESVRAFMTEHQALRIALASETRAENFYRRALHSVTDEAARALFTEMCKEELEHQKLVRDLLDKLPPEDTSNPDDYVDEPAGQ